MMDNDHEHKAESWRTPPATNYRAVISDPLDRATFKTLMISLGLWNARLDDATRTERAHFLGSHHRRLLLQSATGRRRLRAWLDAQRGSTVIERHGVRCRSIAARLQYFGDLELLPALVDALATLPRPVVDHVLDACMIGTTGRMTNGWTAGPFPRLRPILLAGHRPDTDVAGTLRHEVAHTWLIEQTEELPTALEHDAEITRFHDRVTCVTGNRADAGRFVRAVIAHHELQANALEIAWAAMSR